MKTHAIVASALLLSSCGAQAQLNSPLQAQPTATPQAAPVECPPGHTAMRVTLKESFRYTPNQPTFNLRDGTHRYLVIQGCMNGTRVRGTATTGVENDAHYQNPIPVGDPAWTRTRDFTGYFENRKLPAHGSWDELRSDSGDISASGNFYYNRDVVYKVDALEIPASVITGK